MRRELGQLSLADGLVEGGAGRNRQLEKIAALVDWAAFERLLGEVYAAPVGRPSYGPVVLLRCLLLQQWYRLSDPGLEEALSDRLSFRRFVGLALADPVPDHSTLSRFRSELGGRDLAEPLLAELNRQLDAKGLMVKTGTLIDASLVAADGRRPRKGEPAEGRSDRMPAGTRCRRSRCSATRCTSRSTRARAGAPGDPHPGHVSDKAPFSIWFRATSRRCTPTRATMAGGIAGAGPSRASRTASWPATTGSGRSMPPATPVTGRIGRIRAPVERTFAILKRWYGYPGCATAAWSRTPSSCSCSPRAEPAPRPGADRLRADSARTTAAAAVRSPTGRHPTPSAPPSSRLLAVPRRRGTNSA